MTEQWSLVAGHHPDWLWAVVVGLCLGWAMLEAVSGFRRSRLPIRLRSALLGLRLLALVGLVAIAFELTLRVETVSTSGPRVVVLIDTSESMALADAESSQVDPLARIDRLRTFWQAHRDTFTTWEQAGLTVQYLGFSDRVQELTNQQRSELQVETNGRQSNLTRALTELSGQRDPRPLAAVVVMSDGLHAPDPASQTPLFAVAEQLGVPISTVWSGASYLRDVSVADVRAGEFAFVENRTEFEVDLVSHGYASQPAKVQLQRDGEILHTTSVTLPDDGVILPLRFEVAPDRVGQFVFEVVVEPLAEEATTKNNRRAFIVKVLRDKVRVLHVAGRPDWDVRALRTLLRRDPNVELLSYYILRGLDDSQRESLTAPLSLIAFPTDELFESQLDSFDLVVLHNFDAANHQVGQYLSNIARYVREGGSLVVIGGDMGLATGEYNNAQLNSLVPVDLGRGTGMQITPFRPRLTEEGQHHPLTGWLREHKLENWQALPQLRNHNPVAMARAAQDMDTTVLLRHPADNTPLLTVAEPAKGRVVVLATGDSWRLGFAPDLPLVEGSRPYDLLWLRTIRWLLRDANSDRLQLETDRPSYPTGATVTLQARALTSSYRPAPDVSLGWDVRPLARDDDQTKPAKPTAVASGKWTTDSLGRATVEVPQLVPGAYEAHAWERPKPSETAEAADAPQQNANTNESDKNEQDRPRARRVFLVGRDDRELSLTDADPGQQLLERLAERTGGVHIAAEGGDLPDAVPQKSDLAATEQQVHSRRDVPLWDGWWALLLVVSSLGGEWLLRRRAGLV